MVKMLVTGTCFTKILIILTFYLGSLVSFPGTRLFHLFRESMRLFPPSRRYNGIQYLDDNYMEYKKYTNHITLETK